MSMLIRYKKPGGFIQLLKLMETSGTVKREKFLKMIEAEDPVWADAIQSKMITLDKLLAWDDNALAEVFSRQNDITVAVCKHVFTAEDWDRVSQTFSHSKKRMLDELSDEKSPNDAEKSTAVATLLTGVRKMVNDGYIKLDKIDPNLVIPDDIEEQLQHMSPSSLGTSNSGAREARAIEEKLDQMVKSGASADVSGIRDELTQLKKKIVSLGNENSQLRKENDAMKEKLDKIRKIA